MSELIKKLKVIFAVWDFLKHKNASFNTETTVRFERSLAKYFGIRHAVTVASGTDALVLSLKALGVGPGDEVIVPALSFYSTAGAVAWVGAKPVFVDIDSRSFNIDVSKIEQAITGRTKAIIAVHLNGRMADMEAIAQIAKSKSLFVIEDAAQALGARYNGKMPGQYGDVACLSFNPMKILTAGGDGGAVVTNDDALAGKISLLKNYGSTPNEFGREHYAIGIASRLSPYHAAVMNVKFAGMYEEINRCRKNYFLYSEMLSGIPKVVLPEIPSEEKFFINGSRYLILADKRDEVLKFLQGKKIDARAHYATALPRLEAFAYLGHKYGDFPEAEKVAAESIALPTGPEITADEIKRIAGLLRNYYHS